MAWNLQPILTWWLNLNLQDDVLLKESSHFTFVYDDPEFSLVILNACPEHSGVYTCTAKNLAGTNSCKAELTVHTGSAEPRHPHLLFVATLAAANLTVSDPAERKEEAEPMEDEGTILRKMRRLVDYYDVHKEIGR